MKIVRIPNLKIKYFNLKLDQCIQFVRKIDLFLQLEPPWLIVTFSVPGIQKGIYFLDFIKSNGVGLKLLNSKAVFLQNPKGQSSRNTEGLFHSFAFKLKDHGCNY